ncbi:MAG: hypothetical protein ABIG71_03605 [Candidatus Uhrbacteria bacterium]
MRFQLFVRAALAMITLSVFACTHTKYGPDRIILVPVVAAAIPDASTKTTPSAPAVFLGISFLLSPEPAERVVGWLLFSLADGLDEAAVKSCVDDHRLTVAFAPPDAKLRGYAKRLSVGLQSHPLLLITEQQYRAALLRACAADITSDNVRAGSSACDKLEGVDAMLFLESFTIGASKQIKASVVCTRTGITITATNTDVQTDNSKFYRPNLKDFKAWLIRNGYTAALKDIERMEREGRL